MNRLSDHIVSLRSDMIDHVCTVLERGTCWRGHVIITEIEALEYCLYCANRSGVESGFDGLSLQRAYDAYRRHKQILKKYQKSAKSE